MIKIASFQELNAQLTANNALYGAIIFSDKGWNKKEGGYSLAERTYMFSGSNKAFGDYAGYSCFASDVAEKDVCIRLEQYWGRWERISCFVMEKEDINSFKKSIEEGKVENYSFF